MNIKDLLKTTRNPYEIQRRVAGSKLGEIKEAIRKEASELPGWGRVELQPHILSRRRASAHSWPSEDLATLAEHRRMHDQGRVTMCQGRDGDWILQYAIPAQRPIKRSAYFYGG